MTLIPLLSRIGEINTENFNDSGIIVLDLNDSVSLINLSPGFSIYALGSCCSPYQNLLVKKTNDSLLYFNELVPGELLGVYLTQTGKVDGLLVQGLSRLTGVFESLNSTYNVRYKIEPDGLFAKELVTIRRGEPLDKSDKNSSLKDFGIVNVTF